MVFLYTLDVIGIYLILFYSFISFYSIFFYFVYCNYTLMLWVIICYTLMFWVIDLRSCVVINLVLLEDGIATCYSFIYVTDVIVRGEDVINPNLFNCLVLMLWNHVGIRMSPCLDVKGLFIWILILVTWPTPHPIYVAVGTFQCFCSGMGHLLSLILPPWWP